MNLCPNEVCFLCLITPAFYNHFVTPLINHIVILLMKPPPKYYKLCLLKWLRSVTHPPMICTLSWSTFLLSSPLIWFGALFRNIPPLLLLLCILCFIGSWSSIDLEYTRHHRYQFVNVIFLHTGGLHVVFR